MIVLGVATDKNKYVNEFELSLKKLGYRYEILGLGGEWSGFNTKMILLIERLKECKKDDIVVCADTYDLLFVRPESDLLDVYRRKAKDRVLIGADPVCVVNCDPVSTIKCGWNDGDNPRMGYCSRPYVNGGFIMGPSVILIEMYHYALEHGNNDDQIGISRYISKHCDRFVLDYTGEAVFNYCVSTWVTPHLWGLNLPKLVNGRIEGTDIIPCVIHMPYQPADLGWRSEQVRSLVLGGEHIISGYMEYFGDWGVHVYKCIQYPIYKNFILSIVVTVTFVIIILKWLL